ncbi:hypothetical protein HG444_002225 [Candidatus Saccharibacteria bacterium]|nr:hypothetical protein [Candidatus Saccharibacteria bacterium]
MSAVKCPDTQMSASLAEDKQVVDLYVQLVTLGREKGAVVDISNSSTGDNRVFDQCKYHFRQLPFDVLDITERGDEKARQVAEILAKLSEAGIYYRPFPFNNEDDRMQFYLKEFAPAEQRLSKKSTATVSLGRVPSKLVFTNRHYLPQMETAEKQSLFSRCYTAVLRFFGRV